MAPSATSPTLHDVARASGISKSTVSRVLTGHPYVSPEARRAVLAAVRELGYQGNHAARSLRTRMSNTVGLVVTDLRNQVWGSIAQGMDEVLSESGRTLVVSATGDNPAHEVDVVVSLMQRGVDALVLSLADERSPVLKDLRRAGLPTIIVDRDVSGPFDRLLTDHAPGIVAAAADLLDHGHKRIGLLSAPADVRPGREVIDAFQAAIEGRAEGIVISAHFGEEEGRAGTRALLERADPPTALLVSSTQLLVGALLELDARGLSVPGDISLIGYDPSDVARVHRPPIATIVRDHTKMGETAAMLALQRVEGTRTRARSVTIPNAYEGGPSVAAPPSTR
jgi:LacI family transcriptional regulator